MSEPKVRLSMKVRGAQLLSSQECEKNPKVNYNKQTIVLNTNKKGKISKEIIEVNIPKNRLVTHLLQITKEAYDRMIDETNPPIKKLAKNIFITKNIKDDKGNIKKTQVKTTVWEQMPIKIRLDWHLKKIADYFNAKSYTFEILDD